ncbi:MAG: polysaccharide deacetylase family protein [candidate division Zixibacteria bacterium]
MLLSRKDASTILTEIRPIMNLKSWVKRTLFYSGYYKFRYAVKTSRNKRLLILMYHDLIDNDGSLPQDRTEHGKLTEAEFENQLDAIKECCRVISVEEAIGEIKHGGGLKENSIAITFDDGYASVYDIAFPLLKKHGVCATIYLPTDWINGKLSLWWEDLSDMLLGFKAKAGNIEELGKIGKELKIEPSKYVLNDKISKKMLLQVFSFELMKTGDDRRKKIMDDLRYALFNDTAYKRSEINPITWNQISEMADAGIMFGAHTSSHINLSYVDIELAGKEIADSKIEIENRLGREIKGFAYPYGYDVAGYTRFIPLLEELGFDYACTSWWGNNANNSNLFQLFRNNLPALKSRVLLKRELYINLSE